LVLWGDWVRGGRWTTTRSKGKRRRANAKVSRGTTSRVGLDVEQEKSRIQRGGRRWQVDEKLLPGLRKKKLSNEEGEKLQRAPKTGNDLLYTSAERRWGNNGIEKNGAKRGTDQNVP